MPVAAAFSSQPHGGRGWAREGERGKTKHKTSGKTDEPPMAKAKTTRAMNQESIADNRLCTWKVNFSSEREKSGESWSGQEAKNTSMWCAPGGGWKWKCKICEREAVRRSEPKPKEPIQKAHLRKVLSIERRNGQLTKMYTEKT